MRRITPPLQAAAATASSRSSPEPYATSASVSSTGSSSPRRRTTATRTARWTEPTRRNAPLAAYARDAEIRALDLLEQSLARSGSRPVNEVVVRRLLGSASRDVDELRPQLEARASAMEESATERLRERGERESQELRETLDSQRKHVGSELARRESALKQRTLAFSQTEERQFARHRLPVAGDELTPRR